MMLRLQTYDWLNIISALQVNEFQFIAADVSIIYFMVKLVILRYEFFIRTPRDQSQRDRFQYLLQIALDAIILLFSKK
jgi:hypothetical protein